MASQASISRQSGVRQKVMKFVVGITVHAVSIAARRDLHMEKVR
jgi:hypothetical protein